MTRHDGEISNVHDNAAATTELRTPCAECGALCGPGPEYHPYAFCVLVKAGLNPLTVVLDAVKALKSGGAPDA